MTKKQARQFILAYQGLLPVRKLSGKQGIVDFIKKVGCIQFDPLNKVGENSHLVLQSRVKNYRKQMLEELLYKERKLLDGWDKNQSIYVWEVYKPVDEREYGYYVLPVLYRDSLIASCEPICDNEKSELLINKWWWEEGVVVTDEMSEAHCVCLDNFREYLNLDTICYGNIY